MDTLFNSENIGIIGIIVTIIGILLGFFVKDIRDYLRKKPILAFLVVSYNCLFCFLHSL